MFCISAPFNLFGLLSSNEMLFPQSIDVSLLLFCRFVLSKWQNIRKKMTQESKEPSDKEEVLYPSPSKLIQFFFFYIQAVIYSNKLKLLLSSNKFEYMRYKCASTLPKTVQ